MSNLLPNNATKRRMAPKNTKAEQCTCLRGSSSTRGQIRVLFRRHFELWAEKRRKHAATGSQIYWPRKCCGIGTGSASDRCASRLKTYMPVLGLPAQPVWEKKAFLKGSGEEEHNNTPAKKKKKRPYPSRFLMHRFVSGRALHSPCLSLSAKACETTKLRSWHDARVIRERAEKPVLPGPTGRRGVAPPMAATHTPHICRVHSAGCEDRMLWRTHAADRAAELPAIRALGGSAPLGHEKQKNRKRKSSLENKKSYFKTI